MNPEEIMGKYTNWKVDEHTWIISTLNGTMYLYLLEGDDYALLIDTAYGFGNIREYSESLTNKPVLAANTHGHLDHSGGNGWWQKVYVHEKAVLDMETHADNPFDTSTLPYPDYEHIFIKEGDVISLGNRDIEIIEASSHAVSGLFFHDKRTGYLFCGDELESAQVIQMSYNDDIPELAQRAAQHKKCMKKLVSRLDGISLIFPAHNGGPISKEYIFDYIELDDLIIRGKHELYDLNHFWIAQRHDADMIRRTRHKGASFIFKVYDGK